MANVSKNLNGGCFSSLIEAPKDKAKNMVLLKMPRLPDKPAACQIIPCSIEQ